MVFKKLFGEKTQLQIEGMTCGHCSGRVTKALEDLSGVKKAIVSHEDNNAIVKYDPDKVDVNAMKEAVRKAGYTPK